MNNLDENYFQIAYSLVGAHRNLKFIRKLPRFLSDVCSCLAEFHLQIQQQTIQSELRRAGDEIKAFGRQLRLPRILGETKKQHFRRLATGSITH